jgi:hypothetical protein
VAGLNVLLYILLSFSAVQKKIIDFVLAGLRPRINTEVRIDKVHIGLFNHVNLQGVYIEDQQRDTLLFAKELDVKINIWKLFDNSLQLNSVRLDEAVINISQATPGAAFNFQFLIDAFASSDTLSKPGSAPMSIDLQHIAIRHSRVSYHVLSAPPTPGLFNASRLSVRDLNLQLGFDFANIGNWSAEVNSLSLKEQSGLTIKNLEGNMAAKAYNIRKGNIKLELPHSTLELKDIGFNLFNKDFELNLTSGIQASDLTAFLPNLRELKNEIVVDSRISGKLPLVNIERFSLDYGQILNLKANASMDNVQKYADSNFKLQINQLDVKPKAVEQLARLGDAGYTNPGILTTTGDLHLKASVEGALNSINIQADAWAKQGAIRLAGKVATDTLFDDLSLKANLLAQNFDLSSLAGNESGLKNIDLYLNLDGASIKNMDLQFAGAINRLQYKGDNLKDIRFGGQYTAALTDIWLDANLPAGKIVAEGCIRQGSRPQITFDADLQNLLVDYFYENPAIENTRLTACVKGDLNSLDIADLQGQVVIDSLSLWNPDFRYEPGKIAIEAGRRDTAKYISLKSSIANANIAGNYYFATLVPELTGLLHGYLPCLFAKTKQVKQPKNQFDIDISVNSSENLSKIIPLPVDILEPLNIKGSINAIENRLSINGDIPAIRVGEQEIRKTSFALDNSQRETLNVTVLADVAQGDGALSLNLTADAANDDVGMTLEVQNNHSPIDLNGQLNVQTHFGREEQEPAIFVRILPSDLNLGALKFGIPPASITCKSGRTIISDFGVSLNGRKYIGIDGVVSALPEDSLRVYFHRAQLGDILAAFDVNNIHAEADGEMVATSLLGQSHVHTQNFRLADMIIFGDTLGVLDMQGGWNDLHQLFDFNVSLKNSISTSHIAGKYSASTDSLDATLALERLPLGWLQPFMPDMLNKLTGSVSSNIAVSGKPSAPITKGWLGFNDLYIGVNYTNVTYHISDTIKIFPDRIGFRDLTIEDHHKNKAVAGALISHHNFQDFSYLLNLDLKNFMILNTENRTDSLFYGRLFVSGNVKANGDNNKIDLSMDVRSEKNSVMNITLPAVSEAADYRSIVYINVPQDQPEKAAPTPESSPLPLKLGMNLELTPSIGLNVLLNPVTGDAMQIKGTGQIKFDYDLAADNMTAYGDYVLSDGFVKLNFQNVANLEFRIRKGSKLNFTGDPMRTSFDITAYKRVRTSLQGLDETITSSSKVNVDCILGIKGNIQKMDLTYDISLPDADDDVRSKLKSLISTDDEKVKNFASLVATGSFYTRNGANANFEDNMLTSVASGALSGILNATFRNILGDKWEIDADVAPQDGSFSDVDVNVSTRLFDDRLKINTNLGYRTEQTNETLLIGDFDLVYELSKLWQLKVYNKTNDRFYKQAPTTQGIGIVYTKEAQTLRQLFRSFRRRSE